jgi:uncharacterized membrane protein YdjX (TVP38/TMEM64 family)
MTDTDTTPKGKTIPWAKLLIAAAVIAVCIAAGKHFHFQEKLRLALDWIDGLGAIGPLVFIGTYILACVLFISGAVFTVGAGGVFGLLMGTVYVSIGSTLGATAAFLVGRYLARNWVAKKIDGNKTFKAIDDAVADEGWKIVALTRLSPVFPFVLLNYAFGLTKVPLGHFVLASWIGMLPGTVMFVYIGYLAGEAAAGAESTGALQWGMRILGFIATIVVTVYVTRIARRALDSRIEKPEDDA